MQVQEKAVLRFVEIPLPIIERTAGISPREVEMYVMARIRFFDARVADGIVRAAVTGPRSGHKRWTVTIQHQVNFHYCHPDRLTTGAETRAALCAAHRLCPEMPPLVEYEGLTEIRAFCSNGGHA